MRQRSSFENLLPQNSVERREPSNSLHFHPKKLKTVYRDEDQPDVVNFFDIYIMGVDRRG